MAHVPHTGVASASTEGRPLAVRAAWMQGKGMNSSFHFTSHYPNIRV